MLQELGIAPSNDTFRRSFAQKSNIEATARANRFQLVLDVYAKWVGMKMAGKSVPDIRDIIDNELSVDYNFLHFLNDFRSIINDKSFTPQTECELSTDSKRPDDSCFVLRRHGRIKELFSKDSIKNNALFFVDGV